jgi:hypothetical protein
MNMNEQVISLELAKKLKELNIEQDSYFFWCKTAPILTSSGTDKAPEWKELHLFDEWTRKKIDYYESYSAFSCSELGVMLPKYIKKNDFEYYYSQVPSKHCNEWVIFYGNSFTFLENCEVEDVSEAECKAKMLVYLIENGLMELK